MSMIYVDDPANAPAPLKAAAPIKGKSLSNVSGKGSLANITNAGLNRKASGGGVPMMGPIKPMVLAPTPAPTPGGIATADAENKKQSNAQPQMPRSSAPTPSLVVKGPKAAGAGGGDLKQLQTQTPGGGGRKALGAINPNIPKPTDNV